MQDICYNFGMECPKCGAQIDKNAMVCPNCKKVLKIVCPVCRTVNAKNICRKCGEILVTKCAKCGKINLMKNEKCTKCGYPTEYSALQNESNAETFAVIRIDFSNLDVIKHTLGTNKLFEKFKNNLDTMLNEYITSLGIRRQILKNGSYIIRFNKVYTFESSAKMAIGSAIEMINLITRLNVKMLKKKNVGLKCNFTILKRDFDQDPYDLDSGYSITLLNETKEKDLKALEYCQIITDENFYEIYDKDYKLESLDNVLVDGQIKRFFEINIKEFINIDDFLKESRIKAKAQEDNSEMPEFVQKALEAQDINSKKSLQTKIPEEIELYNIKELISFDDVNCVFYTTDNIRVIDNIVEVLQEVPRGITAIKASEMYQPYTLRLLAAADETGIYQNIIPITCYDDMKYTPYSFFRELVSAVFEYGVSQKLLNTNDYSFFNNVDPTGLIKDLISSKQRDMTNIEEVRNSFYTVFLSLLQSIPDTLIYIENFEKIDASSLYVLGLLFDNFEEASVSYLISYDEKYSLHKKLHYLLSRPYYTEISLLPTGISDIITQNEEFYKDIITDFYFLKIAKYANGSSLFIDYSIQYLIELGVYAQNGNSVEMINPKTVIIPSTLGQLIQRRLNLLKEEKELIKFLTMCVLLGTRIDFNTASSLGFKNWKDLADKLQEFGHLYYFNDCIYFPNYNLLRENLLEIIPKEDLIQIGKELFQQAFAQDIPSPVKAFIYDLMEEHTAVVEELEKLANLNLSLGDFSSYLNCSTLIIKRLDKYSKDWKPEDLAIYKTSIYENIANNIFDYDPIQIRDIVDQTLDDLQKTSNSKNYTDFCSRMIQGAVDNGEYMYALNLTHKILSVMNGGSIDPAAKDFNYEFLLISLIHIKILFGIGAFKECLDIGYNILNALDSSKIDNLDEEIVTREDFKNILNEAIAYIAIADALTLKEDVKELLDITDKLYNFVPKEYEIFLELEKLIKGKEVSVSYDKVGDNVFSNIFYHIIRAFYEYKNNIEMFAKEIHKAKRIAQDSYLPNFELLCDAFIGYAYTQLNSFMKASAILNQVLKVSKEKGMNIITYIAWHILSILNIKQNKYDTAYGMLNNATIQMERSGSECEILTLLNKINMYKILTHMNSVDKAQNCLSQAKYIADKYNLNFDFNIDTE